MGEDWGGCDWSAGRARCPRGWAPRHLQAGRPAWSPLASGVAISPRPGPVPAAAAYSAAMAPGNGPEPFRGRPGQPADLGEDAQFTEPEPRADPAADHRDRPAGPVTGQDRPDRDRAGPDHAGHRPPVGQAAEHPLVVDRGPDLRGAPAHRRADP